MKRKFKQPAPLQVTTKVPVIIRMVEPGVLFPGNACEWDAGKNLLRIDKEIYDGSDARGRMTLWRARDTLTIFLPAATKKAGHHVSKATV